jgi:hypothetical protein
VIAVVLRGGLGNQLFQCALALELASRGRDVVLDVRRVCADRGVAIREVCPDMRLSRWPSLGLGKRRYIPRGLTPLGFRTVEEPSLRFWANVLSPDLPRRVLLHGYWQSPLYFSSVRDDIRRRISSAAHACLTTQGRELLDHVQKHPAPACLHLRRGDYVSNPAARRFHGVVPMSYYERATSMLRTQGVTDFFVFSDDVGYARSVFSERRYTVVPHSVATSPIGELALMAACQVHVLANSSFSWWAAWMKASHGPVIVPNRWFADPTIDTSDLLPATWAKL